MKFYTMKVTGGFLGLCRDDSSLSYGPKSSRDAALSGVKRLARRQTKLASSPPVSTKTKRNFVAFVIDRSGSMSGLATAALKALNDNIKVLRDQSRSNGQKTFVSVVTFDTQIDFVRTAVDIELVKDVAYHEVTPRGATALYDAVGTAIENMSSPNASKVLLEAYDSVVYDDSFLVITVTDGAENASKRYSGAKLSGEIKKLQQTDRWTFAFLVPPGEKRSLVAQLGVYEGNVVEWEATVKGVQTYSAANVAGTVSYVSARSHGINSTQTFYTDLSNVSAKQLKKDLDDLSSKVRVLNVDKEQDIRTFVQNKTGKYVPGSAYYQLTKSEKKIQDYKKLLVMEKNKRSVYGGPDARQALGIPEGELKVSPGNHGNFDIFVQSTSNNRKLVRGTKLLVMK